MNTLDLGRYYLEVCLEGEREERGILERKLEQERKRSARLARTLRGLYRKGVTHERA